MSPLGARWGVEPDEERLDFACDDLDGSFDAAYFRGVTVQAPPATMFRWLCQLRAAPYSYDWLDNGGRRSPRTLIPGLEDLAVGQTMMTIFDLASFERDRHLTIRIKPGSPSERIFGAIAGTYLIVPRDSGCRLLAKLRVRYPKGPIGFLGRIALPPGDLIMMRRQLLNLKKLAETVPEITPASTTPPPA